MTGNEFKAAYTLGQCISSTGVESCIAHVTATRRLVMVHRLGGASEVERRRIGALLRALPTTRTTVLARMDVDDVPVIVTEFLPDFISLRDWLEAAVAVQTTVVIRTMPGSPPVTSREETAKPGPAPVAPRFPVVPPVSVAPPLAALAPSPPEPRARDRSSDGTRRASLVPIILGIMVTSAGAVALFLALRG